MTTVYAKVLAGVVVDTIEADPSFFQTFSDTSPGTWLQTDPFTRAGVHYGANGSPDGGTPLRGNYAGIGYVYDSTNDVFYPPRPFASWTISAPNWTWAPPTPMPTDGKLYRWDDLAKQWVAT